jgi:hypothetical protein
MAPVNRKGAARSISFCRHLVVDCKKVTPRFTVLGAIRHPPKSTASAGGE